MAGSGTVTPIVPGPSGPSTFNIAEPLPYTLLSLARFAQYMQINPVHFQGGIGEEVFPLGQNSCNDLWPRQSWQANDRVSHEDLAWTIYGVEQEIANVLGYWPAPTWTAQEAHMYPRFYRRDMQRTNGLDVSGRRVAIQTNYGKVISPGQRAITLVGTATTTGGSLVYSDADGDGFIERATVELPTDLTDVCELKVYFAGTVGNQRWEIRPERQKSISGGIVTFIFPSWLFIDPDVQATYPTTERFTGIDLTTTANFVTSVDVYREYTDTTATSAAFYWEPTVTTIACPSCSGSGCVVCTLTEQEGCFAIRDAEQGMVAPVPATYASGAWGSDCFSVCRDPDQVKIWYYSGNLQNRNLRGAECRTLDNRLGRAIAHMATARLERPFCNCAVVTALAQKLQEDLSLSGQISYQVTEDLLDNPFGTRRGEIDAWRYIQNTAVHTVKAVAI